MYASRRLSFAHPGKATGEQAKVRTGLEKTHCPGSQRGLAETWAKGVGLRPTEKSVDEPPNPNAARAAFLPDANILRLYIERKK